MSRASHLNDAISPRQPGAATMPVAANRPGRPARPPRGDTDDVPCAPHDRTLRARVESSADAPTVAQLTSLFALLANETRLRIVLALRVPATRPDATIEMCVCDLAVIAAASQSHTSHQLRALRFAGIVTARRAGKQMLYRLADAHLNHLLGDGLAYSRTRKGS